MNDLESNRSAYRAKMTTKDGCTPEQQIAMTLLHNVDVVGGNHLAVSLVIPKQTLRALLKRGIINEKARLTTAGNNLLRSWLKKPRPA